MKVFLLVFLFGNSIYLFGQDKFGAGYYISQNRDTVKGFLEYRNNYDYTFKFRSIARERSKELSTENVIQFGFTNGSIYRMIDFAMGDFAPTPVFAQVVVDGQIDLLSYHGKLFLDGGGVNRFQLAGRKASNHDEAIKNLQKNTGYFNILFEDCPEVRSQSSKVIPTTGSMINLLSEYHKCNNATYVNYSKMKKQIILGFSIGVALPTIEFEATSNNADLTYLGRSTFQNSPISPLIGIHYVSRGRRPSSLSSFLMDLQLSKAEFVGSSFYNWEAGGYEFTETSNTIIKYTKIDYRIGWRVAARSNTFNPYASLGFSASRYFDLTSKSDVTFQINDGIEEREEVPIYSRSAGLWGSLGVSKKMKEDHKIFLEVTWDSSSTSNAGSINTTNFKVGYLF